MKIRNGFVSNSSSSSFVAIITKDAYNKALSESSEYIKAVIEAMERKEDTFMGIDIVGIPTYDTHGYTNFEHLDLDWKHDIPLDKDGNEMEPYTAFDEFLSKIPDDQISCHSIDL